MTTNNAAPQPNLLNPAFADAFAREYADRSGRVAAALAKFDRIVLPYPRQIQVMIQPDELRLEGLAKRGKPQNGVRVLAPSRSGKTMAAVQYRDWVMSQPGRDPAKQPVVIVPLEVTGTPKSFFADALAVLGDGFSTAGTETMLKQRLKKALVELGVELLIVDEIQHLAKRQSFGRDISDTLKRFLDDGVVPVAFFGTDEADTIFENSKELNGRLTAPCQLPALVWDDEDDRELFVGFAQRLDEAMVEAGVLRAKAGIAAEPIAELLCESASGIIGHFCNIVKEAVREAVRRDADTFDVDDLAYAVDAWSIQNKFRENNPFLRPRP